MRTLGIIALSLLLAIGCVQKSYKMTRRVNPDNFHLYNKSGTASISGQAFMKTKGGDVKYAAGNKIVLIESTDYTDEFFSALQGGYVIDESAADMSAANYLRIQIGDGEGEFEFKNLPAGSYYLMTTIQWQAGRYMTGGDVFQKIHLDNGESKKVILTR